MTARGTRRRDPLETAIEVALQPGRFIGHRAGSDFVSGLENIAGQLEKLIRSAPPVGRSESPARAARLYETFLAGCYEKAEEVDGSSGSFGMFVVRLYCGWIKARQAAGANADETAGQLLERMDNDPWGFTSDLGREAITAMTTEGLAAFERQVRARFDAYDAAGPTADRARGHDPAYARRRWGDVLRAIYIRRRNVRAYVALAGETEPSASDCLAIAIMLTSHRKRNEALAWVDRGLAVAQTRPHGSMAAHDLAKLRRDLLVKLGRRHEALEEAWATFCQAPSTFSYEALMPLTPKSERTAWRARAMDASEPAELESVIELWLATREIERLVRRLRAATDAEIEGLSHYRTEPAARRLAASHPDVAAKVYRALGLRILIAKKSRYYDAALSHFENARQCYEHARLHHEWASLVAQVREAHHRKVGVLAGLERLAAGHSRKDVPSFLDRARSRWSARQGP